MSQGYSAAVGHAAADRPLRILVLVARDPENPRLGGSEVVLTEWARVLARLGHEVEILCATFGGAARRSNFQGATVRRVGPEGALGISVWWEYVRRRLRQRTDLVVEEMLGGAKVPFLAPLYARVPVVSVWQQDLVPLSRVQFSAPARPFVALIEQLAIRVHRDTDVLCPSRSALESYVARGGAPGRVRIYPMGLSPRYLEQPPPVPAADRSRRVLFLGKLRRYKCPDHAIRVFARVAERVPDARLTIAGRPDDERYFQELRSLVHALDLDAKVSVERAIEEDRKEFLLRTSRVLLSPAPVEGFGIAVLEASACGLPSIGTLGVPEEAITEGVNGYRRPFGDHPAMAELTIRLLTDDALLDRLATGGVSWARGHTWEASARPLLDLIAGAGRAGDGTVDGGALVRE